MKSRVSIALAALLLSAFVSFAAPAARPNIVFILVDDMGYADLGCYGAKDIRTPCVMRWPAKLPQGKVTSQAGITMDLSATFAAVAFGVPPSGGPLPAKAGTPNFDGLNLLPILTGAQPEQERTFFWRIDRTGRKQKAVRHGDWKFLQDGNVELLFNLKDDLGERRDVYRHHPQVMADLKQRLAAWEADLAKHQPEFLVK